MAKRKPVATTTAFASLIPLHKWADSLSVDLRQAYRWRIENRIEPPPILIGRNWFVAKGTKRPKATKVGRPKREAE